MVSQHIIDTGTLDAARRFTERAARAFGVSEAILFGSWARGDFTAESDADMAIVLHDDLSDRNKVARVLVDIAFDVLLETGVLVSPLPLTQREMDEPNTFSNPALIETIRKDGTRL